MQWHKRWIGCAVAACMALPVAIGCEREERQQQVRPEVIEPQTPEGRMEIRNEEAPEDVNIRTRQDEE